MNSQKFDIGNKNTSPVADHFNLLGHSVKYQLLFLNKGGPRIECREKQLNKRLSIAWTVSIEDV